MSKEQTWPYSVVRPGDLEPSNKDIGFNVRGPDGLIVFSRSVEPWVAEQACAALNRRWDQGLDQAPDQGVVTKPSTSEKR